MGAVEREGRGRRRRTWVGRDGRGATADGSREGACLQPLDPTPLGDTAPHSAAEVGRRPARIIAAPLFLFIFWLILQA